MLVQILAVLWWFESMSLTKGQKEFALWVSNDLHPNKLGEICLWEDGWESKQTISSLKLWHALSQLHAMPTIDPSYLAPHGFNLENLFPCYCLFSLNRPKTKQSMIQYVRIVANGIFLPPRPDSFLRSLEYACCVRAWVHKTTFLASTFYLSHFS